MSTIGNFPDKYWKENYVMAVMCNGLNNSSRYELVIEIFDLVNVPLHINLGWIETDWLLLDTLQTTYIACQSHSSAISQFPQLCWYWNSFVICIVKTNRFIVCGSPLTLVTNYWHAAFQLIEDYLFKHKYWKFSIFRK